MKLIYKLSIAMMFVIFASGCDKLARSFESSIQADITDRYPELKEGIGELEGYANGFSADRFHVNGMMFHLINSGGNCTIIAKAESFGKYSLRLIPRSMTCNNQMSYYFKIGEVGDYYVDVRFFDHIKNKVLFQVYEPKLIVSFENKLPMLAKRFQEKLVSIHPDKSTCEIKRESENNVLITEYKNSKAGICFEFKSITPKQAEAFLIMISEGNLGVKGSGEYN